MPLIRYPTISREDCCDSIEFRSRVHAVITIGVCRVLPVPRRQSVWIFAPCRNRRNFVFVFRLIRSIMRCRPSVRRLDGGRRTRETPGGINKRKERMNILFAVAAESKPAAGVARSAGRARFSLFSLAGPVAHAPARPPQPTALYTRAAGRPAGSTVVVPT